MTDGVIFKTNLPDFNRQMQALKNEMQAKVARSATLSSGNVFKKLVIQFAPVLKRPRNDRSPGLLKRSIYIKRSSDVAAGYEHYFIGARGSANRRGTVSAFYWRFVEAGHLARGRGTGLKGGDHLRALSRRRAIAGGAKRVPGTDYLKRAFDAGKEPSIAAFYKSIQRWLDKVNAKK